jgi:hypothetical protein
MVHKVWGQTDPPSCLGRISVHFLALEIYVKSTTLYSGSFFTSKHDRSISFIMRNRLGCWKTDYGGTWYSTLFGTPFADISREMGQNGVPGQLLLRFAPFLSQWYSLLKCRLFIQNDTIGSVGGEIWQIGGEKWGSRRGQLGICAATGCFQAQV